MHPKVQFKASGGVGNCLPLATAFDIIITPLLSNHDIN